MYPTSGAVIRHDLNTVVEEASQADAFLIGAQVMPPLAVGGKSGTYPKIKIAAGGLMEAVATERERGSSYGQISRNWGSDTYDCIDRGLEEAVDDCDQNDLSRFFNAEATAARLTMRNIKLAHEKRVADATMNTTNYGSATNSAVAYTSGNLATISFVADVLAAIERVADNGAQPNTIVMSSTVMSRLKQSTLVKDWVRGSIVGNKDMPVNAANLAASFSDEGIERVLVGRARYNSAKKGAAFSASNIWANTYIWVGYINPAASDVKAGGAGFTFYWNQEGGLFVTETYRAEARRSNMVRVRQNTTEKVTDATSATLIATQYS